VATLVAFKSAVIHPYIQPAFDVEINKPVSGRLFVESTIGPSGKGARSPVTLLAATVTPKDDTHADGRGIIWNLLNLFKHVASAAGDRPTELESRCSSLSDDSCATDGLIHVTRHTVLSMPLDDAQSNSGK
jgi:hypothetical protein